MRKQAWLYEVSHDWKGARPKQTTHGDTQTLACSSCSEEKTLGADEERSSSRGRETLKEETLLSR